MLSVYAIINRVYVDERFLPLYNKDNEINLEDKNMFKIDAIGQACPKPVLMTKAAVSSGEAEIETLVDNDISVSNLERFANSAGYNFSVSENAGIFAVTLIRDENAATPVATALDTLAVFVTENRLGSAQNELGTNLIRMYFYTLTQMDKAPTVVALMNEGVALACTDEQTVSHLQMLISMGTRVMVCGTCLNFYNLKDSLACGTISNMYEILEAVTSCSKVMKI